MVNNLKRLTATCPRQAHIHPIGIGGVSMRPLGLVLRHGHHGHRFGHERLRLHRRADCQGHRSTHRPPRREYSGRGLSSSGTAAAHNDNPEVAAARAQGIPGKPRAAQAWGVIMREYKNAICVSGTHGKTTTTGMLTHIFMQAQRDPTAGDGRLSPLLHAGHRVGSGDTIIMESCEYCDSFLNFYPTVAIVNNIEADHLTISRTSDAVKRSVPQICGPCAAHGHVIANGDDANTVQTLSDLNTTSPLASMRTTISTPRGFPRTCARLTLSASVSATAMWICRSTAATMSIMRWLPQAPPHGRGAWMARMSPRALPVPRCGLPHEFKDVPRRGTSMTTMPTIPASCTPSSTPWLTWAISA